MSLGPSVEGMYTMHVGFKADSDVEAMEKVDALFAVTFPVAEYVHLTDADDWAEHVSLACHRCGEHKPDLRSIGEGNRFCEDCIRIKNESKRRPA